MVAGAVVVEVVVVLGLVVVVGGMVVTVVPVGGGSAGRTMTGVVVVTGTEVVVVLIVVDGGGDVGPPDPAADLGLVVVVDMVLVPAGSATVKKIGCENEQLCCGQPGQRSLGLWPPGPSPCAPFAPDEDTSRERPRGAALRLVRVHDHQGRRGEELELAGTRVADGPHDLYVAARSPQPARVEMRRYDQGRRRRSSRRTGRRTGRHQAQGGTYDGRQHRPDRLHEHLRPRDLSPCTDRHASLIMPGCLPARKRSRPRTERWVTLTWGGPMASSQGFGSWRHLAGRFFGALSPAGPPPEDEERAWARCSTANDCCGGGCRGRTNVMPWASPGTPSVSSAPTSPRPRSLPLPSCTTWARSSPRWDLRPGGCHAGRSDCGPGAVATLGQPGRHRLGRGRLGRGRLGWGRLGWGRLGWGRLSPAASPVLVPGSGSGMYLAHDRLGAQLLEQAGSRALTISWAEEHHLEPARWTVDARDWRGPQSRGRGLTSEARRLATPRPEHGTRRQLGYHE